MLSGAIETFNLFPVQKSGADMTTPAIAVPMPICFKRLHDDDLTYVLTKGINIKYVKFAGDLQFYHIIFSSVYLHRYQVSAVHLFTSFSCPPKATTV